MRHAIISDIHSNLEALVATLEAVDEEGADRVICLGDIVGYGANPNECIEIVRERCDIVILGNHDAAACGEGYPVGFNPIAREAILWTREALSGEGGDFLRSLPAIREVDGFLVVHGAISDPDKYVLSAFEAVSEFPLMDGLRLCFFGHTHMRMYFKLLDDRLDTYLDMEFRMEGGAKYMVNPGSVGQPRDRDPRSAHLVYDDEKGSIEFKRVRYDIEAASKKILDAGLDSRLAARLAYGI